IYPLSGLNFASITQTAITGQAGDSFAVKTSWDASVRGRLGWLFNPEVLIYVTGGVTWLNLQTISTCKPAAMAVHLCLRLLPTGSPGQEEPLAAVSKRCWPRTGSRAENTAIPATAPSGSSIRERRLLRAAPLPRANLWLSQ